MFKMASELADDVTLEDHRAYQRMFQWFFSSYAINYVLSSFAFAFATYPFFLVKRPRWHIMLPALAWMFLLLTERTGVQAEEFVKRFLTLTPAAPIVLDEEMRSMLKEARRELLRMDDYEVVMYLYLLTRLVESFVAHFFPPPPLLLLELPNLVIVKIAEEAGYWRDASSGGSPMWMGSLSKTMRSVLDSPRVRTNAIRSTWQRQAFLQVVKAGKIDEVRCLFDKEEAEEEAEAEGLLITTTDEGLTPILVAAERGFEDVVRFLISKGSNLGTTDPNLVNSHSLYLACEKGHIGVVGALLEIGEVRGLEGIGLCFTVACQEGHADVARALYSARHDISELVDQTGLAYLVFYRCHLEVARFLITELHWNFLHNDIFDFSILGFVSCCNLRYMIKPETVESVYRDEDMIQMLIDSGQPVTVEALELAEQMFKENKHWREVIIPLLRNNLD